MKILLNGKDHNIDKESSLLSFIKELNNNLYIEYSVAIIKNGEIIRKEFWDKTFIKENDKIEIFSIVGGG